MNVIRLMPQLAQVAGVEVSHPKKTLHSYPHLLLIERLLEVLTLEANPTRKSATASVEGCKTHIGYLFILLG